ncbi:MAG: formimidoylglutamate deiminase [Ilumatobacteraceae bacterium]
MAPVPTAYHCELAWLGGEDAVSDVLVTVDGDRITSVSPGRPATPDVVRLAGLTVPGFANGHSHAFHRALRGRTQRGTGSFWTWREQMYALAEQLDPDSYLALARAVYGEMVLTGISAVGEFHYLHNGPGGVPYGDPNAMGDALISAARDAGIRLTLLDACYLRGGPDRELDPTQRRFADRDADAWAVRASALADAPDVRIGAAVHSVRAVDPGSIATVADWAAARQCPLHAHVSEQPAENDQVVAAHGASPVAVLARSGGLGERFTAVHATHLTPGDIDALGSARCSCCICPTTERDLADGIGPTIALRDAGCRLTLGSDSHAVIDLLEEARAIELDERLASRRRGGHTANALLRMATADGHAGIGWPDAGRIEPGALADLTTITLDSVRTAGGGAQDAIGMVVFASTASDVRHVVVGGRVLVRDGRHVGMDVAAELRAALV